MSRLDSFIRRMTAQRACLDQAFKLIADLPGVIIELGLGNGRTYDHLRENLPGRDIFVFERSPSAHPDSTPPPEYLIAGNLDETLPAALARIGGQAALLHSDIGCGDPKTDKRVAALIARHLPALILQNGIVLSDQPLAADGFSALELPKGVDKRRYTFLQRGEARSQSNDG